MARLNFLGVALCVVAGLTAIPRAAPQAPSLTTQLDRYLIGQHDAVVADLRKADFARVLDALKREATPWIEKAPASNRGRRRLVAATYALEAARAAEDGDWKLVQRMNLVAPTAAGRPLIASPAFGVAPAVYWKPPALLIEWGCALLRGSGEPTPAERWWHLAAVSVAQRRGDYEFLIGSPWDARDNPKAEIDHLKHVIARFPTENRFALAQAIAVEWRTWPTSLRRPRTASRNIADAIRAFKGMRADDDIGAEAQLRSGVLLFRSNSFSLAIEAFDAVETTTRDRYLIYLAKYFRGQAHDRSRSG